MMLLSVAMLRRLAWRRRVTAALLCEADPVDAWLDDAEAEMAEAFERPDEEPPWTYFYTPGYLQMQRGLAYRLLDRHDDAVSVLAVGLAAVGENLSRAEFVAQYKVQLAEAHTVLGNRDVAERLLTEVRGLAAATGSARHCQPARLQPNGPDPLPAKLDHVVDIGCQNRHRPG